MERKFLEHSLLRSECSMERKFCRSESSVYGLHAPGNESAEERKGQIPSALSALFRTTLHIIKAITSKALTDTKFYYQ